MFPGEQFSLNNHQMGRFFDMMVRLLRTHEEFSNQPYGMYLRECPGCNCDALPTTGPDVPATGKQCNFAPMAVVLKPWLLQLVGNHSIDSIEVCMTSLVSQQIYDKLLTNPIGQTLRQCSCHQDPKERRKSMCPCHLNYFTVNDCFECLNCFVNHPNRDLTLQLNE